MFSISAHESWNVEFEVREKTQKGGGKPPPVPQIPLVEHRKRETIKINRSHPPRAALVLEARAESLKGIFGRHGRGHRDEAALALLSLGSSSDIDGTGR